MMKKFNTDKEVFDRDYKNKAHHQTSFNEVIIERLSESIARWFPKTSDNGSIKILDLCCGHGKPTYDLLIKLDDKGVNVEKIIGYDISESQIETATKNHGHEDRISFFVRNAEYIEEKNEYDVVVSLFGLHWMESIKDSAKSIFNSLKQNGKVMFFVPLEKMDLFEFRGNFIKDSKYSEYFKDYSIHPFIDDENEYIAAFEKYFRQEKEYTVRGNREIIYSKEQFSTFLSSWMPEIRYLSGKKVSGENYANDLIDSMPHISKNIKKLDENKILFTEHFFSYQGSICEELEKQKYQQDLSGEMKNYSDDV